MSILIRNLSRTTTEAELKALFAPFGEVASCCLVLDKNTGQSKGFGFVDMLNRADVDSAVAALNATKVAGSKIRVKWSNQEAFEAAQAPDAPEIPKDVWGKVQNSQAENSKNQNSESDGE